MGLARLSPQSRYMRFFESVSSLSESKLRYLTEVDFQDHVAYMVVSADDPEEPAVAVGRWIRLVDAPEAAEVAVTVGDPLHRRGIGRMLLWLLARDALTRGIREFRASAMGGNAPILKLIGSFTESTSRWDGGVLEVTIPLPESVEAFEQRFPPPPLTPVCPPGMIHPADSRPQPP
ncbi:MAG: hypothetical protein ACLGIN_13805 [Candidatus Sericytochromatia bacterium]